MENELYEPITRIINEGGPPMVLPCRYRHPRLGSVKVSVRHNSRNMRVRWLCDEVHVSVPPNFPACVYDLIFDSLEPELFRHRPGLKYWIGKDVEAPGLRVRIRFADLADTSVTLYKAAPKADAPAADYIIGVPRTALIESRKVQQDVNRLMLGIANRLAPKILIPRAKELAEAVHRIPLGWGITNNRRALGSCSSHGIIKLSSRIIFLPLHLRDYVIYHELAHLSEMNHSPRFHKLCNEYCGGCEAEWYAQMKAFKFPVF